MLRHWWNQIDLRAEQFFSLGFFPQLARPGTSPTVPGHPQGPLWPTAQTFRPSTTSTNFEALNHTASQGPSINPCGGGNTQGWDVAQALLCVPALTGTEQLREPQHRDCWAGEGALDITQSNPCSTTWFLQWNCPGVSSIKPSQWAAQQTVHWALFNCLWLKCN